MIAFQLAPPRRLCNRRCLSVCLLATLRKNFRTDLHKFFKVGQQWANEQVVKFWWRSGSPSGYRDCFPDSLLWEIRKVVNGRSSRQMAALVRRALAEVCTVPVLLVMAALCNRGAIIFLPCSFFLSSFSFSFLA